MRGQKQIEGQIYFDFCCEVNNHVVQANAMINGKQSLKINSAKLIRAAIMQVVHADKELKPYIITIKDLSKLLNISSSNIYRDIDDITDDIINNPLYIRSDAGNKVRWVKIPWVQRCEYQSDVGVLIKLNDELKPYLLQLKAHYTQYTLWDIVSMKSVYGMRLFEVLQSKVTSRFIPDVGVDIVLSVNSIRECCGIDCKKYQTFSNLRKKVIDAAVKDINKNTMYNLTYKYVKSGKNVVAVNFHLCNA